MKNQHDTWLQPAVSSSEIEENANNSTCSTIWTLRIPLTPIHMSKLLRNTDIWAIKKKNKHATKRTLISQYNCHCSSSCKTIPPPPPLSICQSSFNWCWQRAIHSTVHCTAFTDRSLGTHLTVLWTTNKIHTKQHTMTPKRERKRGEKKRKKRGGMLSV